jgi:hypothetical protein
MSEFAHYKGDGSPASISEKGQKVASILEKLATEAELKRLLGMIEFNVNLERFTRALAEKKGQNYDELFRIAGKRPDEVRARRRVRGSSPSPKAHSTAGLKIKGAMKGSRLVYFFVDAVGNQVGPDYDDWESIWSVKQAAN